MRGDVLLWTSDGLPVSRLIALMTDDPYVHVSVDLGDGTDIGAHNEDGVQHRKLPGNSCRASGRLLYCRVREARRPRAGLPPPQPFPAHPPAHPRC